MNGSSHALLSAALLFAPACSSGSQAAAWCVENGECGNYGRCGLSSFRGGDSGKRCYVRGTDDCKGSRACTDHGRCLYDASASLDCIAGPPIAASGPVCRREIECWGYGRCGVRDGACAAVSSDDCRQSGGCLLHGACAFFSADGFCGAATDRDCADSLECKVFGRCTREKGHPFGMRRVCGHPAHPKEAYADLRCLGNPECLTERRCLRADDNSCKTPEEVGIPLDRMRIGPRD